MTHAGEMMVMINDHIEGPSVHSAQILRKNPGTGQTPPCLSGNARTLGTFGPHLLPNSEMVIFIVLR